MDTNILENKIYVNAIEELKKSSKKRNFDEAIELIYTLKNINLKNREQRVDLTVNLPNPYLKTVKSLVFVKDKNLASELKGVVDKIIMDDEISKISKKEGKKLAEEYRVFLAEGPVMLTVGKYLGQVLSPRGKMPLVAPPNVNAIKTIIENSKSQQKVSNKKTRNSVAIQTKVGVKSQSSEHIAENCVVMTRAIVDDLPIGEQNIKSVYIKSTMSKPINLVAGDKK